MQIETFGKIAANRFLSGQVNAEAEELRASLARIEKQIAGVLIGSLSGGPPSDDVARLKAERTRLTERLNDLALVLKELRRQRRALKRQDGAQRVQAALSSPCGASPCPYALTGFLRVPDAQAQAQATERRHPQ